MAAVAVGVWLRPGRDLIYAMPPYPPAAAWLSSRGMRGRAAVACATFRNDGAYRPNASVGVASLAVAVDVDGGKAG